MMTSFLKNLLAFLIGLVFAAGLLSAFGLFTVYRHDKFNLNFLDDPREAKSPPNYFEINEDPDVPPEFMTMYPGISDRYLLPDVQERLDTSIWHVYTKRLGYEHKPNAKIRHQLREGNSLIFNVTYRTDEFARRITPVSAPEKRDKFLIFFGCSFTWGSCLFDHQTIPALSGKWTQSYKPYNYAKAGSGINWTLALLENRNLSVEVSEKAGIAVYTFIDDHVGRAVGDLFHSRMLFYTPYYEIENGTAVRKGNFLTGRPILTRFYSFLQSTDYVKKNNPQVPVFRKKHFDYYCELVEEVKNKFNDQFPRGTFYTFFHPLLSAGYGKQVAQCLKEKGINVIHFPELYYGFTDKELQVKHDKHPSALANELVTKTLIKALEIENK